MNTANLDFKTLMAPFKRPKGLAIAVSGGPDSMALAYLAGNWARNNNIPCFAVTVDHKLRPESSREAYQVNSWLTDLNIPHVILTWEHNGVDSRIQERARNARYELLSNFCKHYELDTLVTAHHIYDQWETFMMRLSRGSGLKGLCAMRPLALTKYGCHVRPLLYVNPYELRQLLDAQGIPYVNDPSNENTQFSRIRWRNRIPELSQEGLTPEMLELTINEFQEIDDFLEELTLKARIATYNAPFLNVKLLLENFPLPALKRLLNEIIREIGGSHYPIPREPLQRLVNALVDGKRNTITLGNCLIHITRTKGETSAQFERENRA